ncbi:MAG: DUF1858 domain-containing protein [Bacteroidales bacterium]|nr:DUF1858 domain-containing protein [Bacteroidales bacterium]NLK81982.1 DUF1858 domain-containing protein [Bacteroidales bacterium]HPY82214.1 DUF1858 domain-containing protein [Bacteroidales bacterium]
MKHVVITPRTIIYDLLEAYPQLENVLIQAAPPFKKLQNPILRKTIARITNLSQAAIIGGISVDELIHTLRSHVGQEAVEFVAEQFQYVISKPQWYVHEQIVQTIDIREMLERGEQPVHMVFVELKKISKGQIVKIIAPFVPAPLIDKSLSLGYSHWVHTISEHLVEVFFTLQTSN